MHPKQKRNHASWRQIITALAVLAGLLLPALPARAIVDSDVLDAPGDYPYVGAAWLVLNCCDDDGNPFESPIPPDLPLGDNRVRTSGVLVAPNVFLTGGTQYRNGRRVAVTFENPIQTADFTDFYDPGTNPDGGAFEGYVFHMPGLDREDEDTFARFDLAVIVLDFPVPDALGVPIAPIADLGALNPTKKSKTKELIAVSYGPDNHDPETWDFQRRTSEWETKNPQATSVRLKGEDHDYFVCDGDQGAPLHTRSGDVAALIYIGKSFCGKDQVADAIRLDTPQAREFLCQVGTDGFLDDAEIPNPNFPLLGPDGPLDYPEIAEPEVLTDEFCEAAARSELADDGEQTADRQQNGKSEAKHEGKKGKQNRGKRGR
jgi:hypothetical protein